METSGGVRRCWPEADVIWSAAMKKLALALALTVMGAAGASAQGIQLRIGPDADRYDRGPRERVIVQERRDRDWDRRRVREIETTGNVCRTVVERERNARGQMVTRRVRECD
jgi:hypothetical protein